MTAVKDAEGRPLCILPFETDFASDTVFWLFFDYLELVGIFIFLKREVGIGVLGRF